MYVWLDIATLAVVFAAGIAAGIFYTRRIDGYSWDRGDALLVATALCALLSVASWFARGGLQ